MKKSFAVGLGLVIMSFSILSGCGKKATYEPEKINPDVDVCVVCNMNISATDYGTEVILQDGEIHKFDDIGCMMEYLQENKDKKVAKKYVRDVKTGDWVELQKASFVFHKEIWTPMAYGVVTFSNEKRAKDFIKKEGKGEILTYKQLLKHKWEGF